MIRTFDFIFQLRTNNEKRTQVYNYMGSDDDMEMDIQGWHLMFDSKRRCVVVTSNGTDDYLQYKFIPAEIEYDSLRYLMNSNTNKKEAAMKVRYLE